MAGSAAQTLSTYGLDRIHGLRGRLRRVAQDMRGQLGHAGLGHNHPSPQCPHPKVFAVLQGRKHRE